MPVPVIFLAQNLHFMKIVANFSTAKQPLSGLYGYGAPVTHIVVCL